MARSLGNFQSQTADREVDFLATPFQKQLSMYGRIFIASIFPKLERVREGVVHQINAYDSLKAVSLAKQDKPETYEPDVLKQIEEGVASSNHFVIFAGPESGTDIHTAWRPGWVVPELVKNVPNYLTLTFTELEVILATRRLLKEAAFHGHVDSSRYVRENVLVIQIGEDHKNILAPLTDLGVQPHKLRLPPSEENENVLADNAQFNNYMHDVRGILRDFLKKVEGNKQSRVANYLRWRKLCSEEHLQIIGWSGLEHHNYKGFLRDNEMCDDQLAFLSMNRSVVSLPLKATYIPSQGGPRLDFDFVIADVEVVRHYRQTDAIQSMNDNLNTARGNLHQRLLRLVSDKIIDVDSQRIWALPLMFGFNEILSYASSGSQFASGNTVSYAELTLKSLLEKENRLVVLWAGWWVPTFTCLIYSEILALLNAPVAELNDFQELQALDQKFFVDVECFSDWITDASNDKDRCTDAIQLIEKITTRIVGKCTESQKRRVAFPDHLEAITDHLQRARKGEEVTIIGGSSALLPGYSDMTIDVVRPKEGLFVWVNCACDTKKGTPNLQATKLVTHWLSDGGQKEIWAKVDRPNEAKKIFFGIPVTTDGIKKFCQDESSDFDELRETLRLAGFNGARRQTLPLGLRPFPPVLWPILEFHWNRLRRELSSGNAR